MHAVNHRNNDASILVDVLYSDQSQKNYKMGKHFCFHMFHGMSKTEMFAKVETAISTQLP